MPDFGRIEFPLKCRALAQLLVIGHRSGGRQLSVAEAFSFLFRRRHLAREPPQSEREHDCGRKHAKSRRRRSAGTIAFVRKAWNIKRTLSVRKLSRNCELATARMSNMWPKVGLRAS